MSQNAINPQYQPLERYLKSKSEQSEDLLKKDFPSGSSSYFSSYINTKYLFQETYYKTIDIAANIDASNGTVFTKHGTPHVDALINHAGNILGINIKDYDISINGYESFLLLMSILVHDLGMCMGREGHEKKCENIMLTHRDKIGLSLMEAKIIGEIAAAHTGRDPETKEYVDTFCSLEQKVEYLGVPYRKRVLASIVRFADEISENSQRALDFVESNPNVNEESKLRHAYCKSIAGITPNPITHIVSIDYYISVEEALRIYQTKDGNITLVEHIVNCLKKMDQERTYCTRYFAEAAYLATIEAQFHIYTPGDYKIHSPIIQTNVRIGDAGYPAPKQSISSLFSEISPEKIREQYLQQTGKSWE